MKLGAKGFISYKTNQKGELFSQAFPALIPNPIDVTGAEFTSCRNGNWFINW